MRLAPRKATKTKLRDAFGQEPCGFLARRHSPGLVREHNGIEPPDAARPQRANGLIEFDFVLLMDAMAGGGGHVRFIGCGREQDARRSSRS